MGKGVTSKEVSLSASWNPRHQVVEIYGAGKDGTGKICFIKPIEFTDKEKERFDEIEPVLLFDGPEKLQVLFDDLWRIGLRPTEKADGYKAELRAVKEHLKDMQAIVFKRMVEDIL